VGGDPVLNLWSPLDFEEMIVNAWMAEDVADGAVAEVASRPGVRAISVTQTTEANRPTKVVGEAAIESAASSGQRLGLVHEADAWSLNRWGLIIFRMDGATGSAASPVIFEVNSHASLVNGHHAPRIFVTRATGAVTYVQRGSSETSAGTAAEAATANRSVVSGTNAVVDGTTWNVVVWYRRNGKMHVSVNAGTEGVLGDAVTGALGVSSQGGRIGDSLSTNAKWAWNCVIVGQSELNEAQVKKLEAWGMYRVGREGDLPSGHPYENAPPLVDANDFPERYNHNATAWAAFKASLTGSTKYANRGQPMEDEGDTVVVFLDDFRADTIDRSVGAPKGTIWHAPGWNSAVGDNATLLAPQQTPDCFPWSSGEQTLRLTNPAGAGWRTAAMYTVNSQGQGRYWGGPRVLEMRCKFGNLIGGLFPAFWGYALEHLFWRTGERVETDYWEFRGEAPTFLNGCTTHVHAGTIAGYGSHLASDASQAEIAGFSLVTPNWVEDFSLWDGDFHTWTFNITEDYVILNLDGFEIARAPTPQEYLLDGYIIMDQAYTAARGAGTVGTDYDMIVDYVEVRVPRSIVESFPAPFTARPTIGGTTTQGQTLTVTPNLPAEITDRDYYWYRSGYPIIGAHAATYQLAAADVGSAIRCEVRAVGAVNQPRAWTDETAVVAGA
jgi:hypothetical protein